MLFQRKKVKPITITVSCTKRALKTNTNIKLNFDLIAKIVQNKKKQLVRSSDGKQRFNENH